MCQRERIKQIGGRKVIHRTGGRESEEDGKIREKSHDINSCDIKE